MNRDKPFTVRELNREIIELLETGFPDIWVEGEVGSLRRPPSGHVYFNLKEENEIVRVVFFRSAAARGLDFEIEDGQQVRVRGRVSGYAGRSEYQVIATRAEQSGLGRLLAALEELKKKLRAEGLFEEERKKNLPAFIRRLGVVTSPTGAAVRDIMSVLERRSPAMELVIYPALVQGPGAAAELVAGIKELNRLGDLDAILLTRGGGSLEELWPFNEEILARAICASRIPVISAVGHEVDYTISDFVADMRAPTPSAAAEILSAHHEEMRVMLRETRRRIVAAGENLLRVRRRELELLRGRYGFRRPRDLLETLSQRVDDLSDRLARAMDNALETRRRHFQSLERGLRNLSPLAVLERGYSITSRARDGRVIRDPAEAQPGTDLVTRLARGEIQSRVTGRDDKGRPEGDRKEEPATVEEKKAKNTRPITRGAEEQGCLF